MAKSLQEWKVLPHGQLTPVADNILTVVGQIKMPIGEFPRRMTVVRVRDGRLVIFSAIALAEEEMQNLESYGTPAFLIVPSDHHRMDAKAWKARYPALQVIAPPGALDKVAKTVSVDATTASFNDPNVELVIVPGTRDHEAALIVKGANGTTLVVNDVIANIHGTHGFGGWLLRVMGFAGDGPHVPVPIKATVVSDKALLREQLIQWSQLPGLARVLVSHGDLITANPAVALKELAKSLE